MMICESEREVIGFQGAWVTITAGGRGRRAKNLVVDVRDVHNEVNIITKVIGHDAPKDVLGHIIPGNG